MRLYKVLNDDRSAIWGNGVWPEPGEWLKVEGALQACKHGLHLCDDDSLIQWLGPAIWEPECSDGPHRIEGKLLTHRARLVRRYETWTPRVAALYAADCAEDVLHLFESRFPDDDRPRKAIAVARYGGRDEARAVWAAARAATWVARAVEAAWAAWAAREAAAVAARAEAGTAGTAAETAKDGAQRWQTARLMRVIHDPTWLDERLAQLGLKA